ncbi:unnamed protein product [Darwinula stevensoni]|uniref:Uncharacterized protein n=1 Tax=Darwinula stevensoni TaxID=69355 RepID=A0A7R9FQC1_9CRUS|nr:unnamed protein product [Darwinula stevensoni]CAG0899511.1 unnamed protein product [Darwinula stevensoni]
MKALMGGRIAQEEGRDTINLSDHNVESCRYPVFSVEFLVKCREQKEVVSLDSFLFSKDQYFLQVSPNKVLEGEELWPDVTINLQETSMSTLDTQVAEGAIGVGEGGHDIRNKPEGHTVSNEEDSELDDLYDRVTEPTGQSESNLEESLNDLGQILGLRMKSGNDGGRHPAMVNHSEEPSAQEAVLPNPPQNISNHPPDKYGTNLRRELLSCPGNTSQATGSESPFPNSPPHITDGHDYTYCRSQEWSMRVVSVWE